MKISRAYLTVFLVFFVVTNGCKSKNQQTEFSLMPEVTREDLMLKRVKFNEILKDASTRIVAKEWFKSRFCENRQAYGLFLFDLKPFLIGMSRRELLDLLGEPDGTQHNTGNYDLVWGWKLPVGTTVFRFKVRDDLVTEVEVAD